MSKRNRWLCAVLSLVLTACLVLPARAADPLADSFADFLIDAAQVDALSLTLHVELYRQDESNTFQADRAMRYEGSVNRAADVTDFYIQPQADGVWAEVNYLTDLDGDGAYEMLDGEDTTLSDVMTPDGQLVPWDGTQHTLSKGQTYILSPEILTARGEAALQARNTPGGSQALPQAGTAQPNSESILYLLTLHYLSPVDQEEYVLGYYLQLFDTVIVPSDVPSTAWYYQAVEYALEQGFFSGTGEDSFSPGGGVTRAQLAQILWRMGGSAEAEETAFFSDVAPSDWYAGAVSWCCQEGLMSGTDAGFLPNSPLSREQLALVLMQYAQYAGLDTSGGTAHSSFSDGSSASSWARAGLEWAVGQGFLSGYDDGSLRPANGITRAELAAVLRTFSLSLPTQEAQDNQ